MTKNQIKKMLEQQKLYVETNGKQGKEICERDVDLRHMNAEGINLTGAYFRGCNLQGVNFSGSNLSEVRFDEANLRGANLSGTTLFRACFSDTQISGANFQGANFHSVDLCAARRQLSLALGLPDISWIIPGTLCELNVVNDHSGFWITDRRIGCQGWFDNFIEGSLGVFIQDNPKEGTFDILAGDRIIRDVPQYIKYGGLSRIASI